MNFTLLKGDCLEQLKRLHDNSIESIVTDPPYGLSFMRKKWDYDVPSVEIWKECLRVLKPGGHLLSFSSARTYHRMTCNVEDAGFEIRDQLIWIKPKGIPKGGSLKPQHEPIALARKPFKGTRKKCVEDNGTGLIQIEACKTDRFPSNVIHSGLDEPWSSYFYCATPSNRERNAGCEDLPDKEWMLQGLSGSVAEDGVSNKNGTGTVRGKSKNYHPTVKPIKLMSYLCRLITPPGGVVLDPFTGSGSTGVAALQEGFSFFGVELDEEYIQIAQHRLVNTLNNLQDLSGDQEDPSVVS